MFVLFEIAPEILEADIAFCAKDAVPKSEPVILPLTLKDPVIVVFPTIVVLPVIKVDPVIVIPLFTVTPPSVNVAEPDDIKLFLAVRIPPLTVKAPLKFEDPVTNNAWRLFAFLSIITAGSLFTPSNGKLTVKDPVFTVKDDDCIIVEPDNIVFPIFLKLPDIIAEPVNGNVPPATDKAKDAVTALWAKEALIEF